MYKLKALFLHYLKAIDLNSYDIFYLRKSYKMFLKIHILAQKNFTVDFFTPVSIKRNNETMIQ